MLSNHTADFLTELEGAGTPSALWSMTAGYLDGLGLTHSIYTYVNPREPDFARTWTSLPDSWCDRYADKNYWAVDPFYRYCCTTLAPIRTGPEFLDEYDFLTEPERRVICEGGETGFRSGFSAPVRLIGGGGGFGGWNFGSIMGRRELDVFLKEHGRDLRLAGFYIHEHAERLSRSDEAGPLGLLTPRERECLLWLGRGLRTAAIADRLGIAQVTVDLHFKGARRKLRAATREEALAKAILGGQIDP